MESNRDEIFQTIHGESNSLLSKFESSWIDYTETLLAPYTRQHQIRKGNHLRPILTFWGYMLSKDQSDRIDEASVIELAIGIELLHKSSILIDDLLDNDIARHGLPTFHTEFSESESYLVATYLLINAIDYLNIHYSKKKTTSEYPKSRIKLFISTIKKMLEGGIKELTLSEAQFRNKHKIKEIIELETISLIKNSLLLGYLENRNTVDFEEVEKIGYSCGYMFQVLNDLEPFSNIEKIKEYKGNKNFDISNSRKSIVVTYIINYSTKGELKKLDLYQNDPENVFQLLCVLYEKYNIIDEVHNIIQNCYHNIELQIQQIEKKKTSNNALVAFKGFIDLMYKKAFSRLGHNEKERLWAIFKI